MKRRLFNFLTAASLAICFTLLADRILRPSPGIVLQPPPPPTMTVTYPNGIETFNYHVSSVSYRRLRTYNVLGFRVPFPTALELAAILPVCWGLLRVAKALTPRRGPGFLCSRCGYDLRATPDRCPECGTVPVEALEWRRRQNLILKNL